MTYTNDVHSFNNELASRLRALAPSAKCHLQPFTLVAYEEEIWELAQNVADAHRFFIVGQWVYMVEAGAVDAFDPEDFEDQGRMFPWCRIDQLVAAFKQAMRPRLLKGVLAALHALHPHLQLAVFPKFGLEVLYDPETEGATTTYSGGLPEEVKTACNHSICAWTECGIKGLPGCVRIGVKGSSGKSFYIVGDMMYKSGLDSATFDPTCKSTYISKEPFDHDSKWLMGKLTAASPKWLGETRPNNRAATKPQPRAVTKSQDASSWRAQTDSCPPGPQVDSDGFAVVQTKKRR